MGNKPFDYYASLKNFIFTRYSIFNLIPIEIVNYFLTEKIVVKFNIFISYGRFINLFFVQINYRVILMESSIFNIQT